MNTAPAVGGCGRSRSELRLDLSGPPSLVKERLINQTRYELARQLLQNTDLPVSGIAAALQYANPNAFSRAFGKWAT
jgi:AraC-like DNA-binding protein